MVDEAPAPALARLEGPHHGMAGLLVVLGRVPQRRGVAAADVTADQTQPQLHRVVPAARHSGQVSLSGSGSGCGSASACVHCFMIARLRRVRGKPRGNEGGRKRWTSLPLLLLVAGSAAVAGPPAAPRCPRRCCWSRRAWSVSYVPGVPDYTLDPHIVLPLLLPPLLYTAAVDSSYLDLRAQLRPVALLSVGLRALRDPRRRLGRRTCSCRGCR